METGPVVTLTMNPALDLSTTVDRVEPFQKLRCAAVRRDPGGGGINVARVVHRLGGRATALFPVGGPAGELLLQLVAAEGVDCAEIAIAGDTREDFTVFETQSGRQFRFVAPGPALSEAEQRRCLDAFADALARASYAVVSGSLPPGVPDAVFAELARRARARAVRLAVDTTGAGLKAALAEGVALIKPNQNELAELAGLAAPDAPALIAAARELAGTGRVEAVALTLAGEGAVLVTRDRAWRAQAPKVEAVSTVGAGDSFLGAMIWSLTRGEDLPHAFGLGVAAGSAALLSPGTDLAHPGAIHRLAAQVAVEAIA